MATAFYPQIEAKNLTPYRTIRAMLEKDPNYLDAAECPYTSEVRGFLKVMMGVTGGADGAPPVALDSPEDLELQLNNLYAGLIKFGNTQASMDQADKVSWAKAVTGILDRVIGLRERVLNARNFSDFQKRVIDILETILTPAQRSDFVERLGKHLKE